MEHRRARPARPEPSTALRRRGMTRAFPHRRFRRKRGRTSRRRRRPIRTICEPASGPAPTIASQTNPGTRQPGAGRPPLVRSGRHGRRSGDARFLRDAALSAPGVCFGLVCREVWSATESPCAIRPESPGQLVGVRNAPLARVFGRPEWPRRGALRLSSCLAPPITGCASRPRSRLLSGRRLRSGLSSSRRSRRPRLAPSRWPWLPALRSWLWCLSPSWRGWWIGVVGWRSI